MSQLAFTSMHLSSTLLCAKHHTVSAEFPNRVQGESVKVKNTGADVQKPECEYCFCT